MRNDDGSKLKSIFVVMTMLLAALTAGIVMMGSVLAVAPDAFSITAPADNAILSGANVNITWDAAGNYSGAIVKVDGTEVANVTTDTYYVFSGPNFKGTHTISVMAYNSSDWSTTYATNDNITVHIFGTPGISVWECGNYSVGYGVINISTEELEYGETITPADFEINNTANWGTDTYCLYYPVYDGSYTDQDYNLTWKKYGGNYAPEVTPPGDLTFGETGDELDVTLNRSGLWLIGPKTGFSPDASSLAQMNATIPAWFWVNASLDLGISISDDEFNYDDTGDVEITISGNNGDARVAIFNETGYLIDDPAWGGRSQQTDDDGKVYALKDSTSFESVGFYNVTAVWDVDAGDGTQIRYREGADRLQYYHDHYGDAAYTPVIAAAADYYLYAACGPWDPPELSATDDEITVNPGEPRIVFINAANRTQYWTFDGRLDINVTDSSGAGLAGLTVTVLNDTGDYPGVYSGVDNGNGNYSIESNWSKGSTGTWRIVVSGDTVGGSTEEWNGTITFTVASAPGLQIKVVDDGDGDNDLEISDGPPSDGAVDIIFQVINASHGYYGKDNPGGVDAARKNITISGDACLLSGKTLQELYEIGSGIVSFDNDKNWTVNLIPLMDTAANGGGEITISAEWDDPGAGIADPVTIQVGGSEYNGSLVSISPAEITIDQNVTLTVTVTDPSSPSYGYKTATVKLYYINNSGNIEHEINSSSSGNIYGEYTFYFNRTQQTTEQKSVSGWSTFKANRYIAVYASIGGGQYGYASAKLVPNHNFKATVEAKDSGSPSTSTMMAGKKYDELYFNVSIVDSTGDVTGYPTIGAGQDALYFRLYNETGEDVTDSISASFDSSNLNITSGGANRTLSNSYIVTPGVYTVYVWNSTYDSRGQNDTLEVKQVDVTCNLTEFIWQYDDNISARFEVKYNGQPVNGTLRIENMTDVGDYNLTWANFSAGGNSTIDLNKNKGFVNGVVVVSDITANYLEAGKSQQDVTFWFMSDEAGSQYARTTGAVPVKIPNVAVSPSTIPVNKLASPEITVTGHETPLEDMWVSIIVPSLTGEQNSTTDSNGKVTFSFTPPSTGYVTIKIENRTSDTKIRVTAWSLYLDIPASADENSTFTATVLNGSATGDPIEGATITFNKKTYITASDGTATIDTPDVAASIDYTIKATKDGYAEASDEIKIINVPKLIITISGKADQGKYSSPVTVIVSDDMGNLITGATVTFDTQTDTTVNGQATFSVDQEKTVTITATMTGFQPGEKTITVKAAGIPGFELLTLIIAIGVAFILLRRRRR